MLRALARPFIASWFVYDGYHHAADPTTRANNAEPLIAPVLAEIGVDVPAETLVRAHAVATVAAGIVLASSRTPRTAGIALTGLAALTIAATPAFWRMPQGVARDVAQEDFVKNVSLLGGVMLAASAGHTERHRKRKKARRVKAKNKAKELKLQNRANAKVERRFW